MLQKIVTIEPGATESTCDTVVTQYKLFGIVFYRKETSDRAVRHYNVKA